MKLWDPGRGLTVQAVAMVLIQNAVGTFVPAPTRIGAIGTEGAHRVAIVRPVCKVPHMTAVSVYTCIAG